MSDPEGCGRQTASRILSDRLETLVPALDERQVASAAAHVGASLATLVLEALPVADALAAPDLDGIVRSVVPALTDADLIVLLLEPNVSAELGYASAPAGCTLLANASPCLQEATLDALITRRSAGDGRQRQLLSDRFAHALLGIANAAAEPAAGQDAECGREPECHDEPALLEAAQHGDEERVAIILAAASGLPAQAIQRAAALRSAKALVSVVWKSGFTMHAGTAVQRLLGHLAPSGLLNPAPMGGYPLGREEMEWHIELLTSHCSA